ncbi:hypothetical protein [Wenjunlia tyrosinilytica]|uniref:hypothetical protein n=1 Tax=Wenjunlia tyrosinilytica TaxID=1544741 RepID=UPI00166ACB53|nr:hypothetical protein [Wenjunlia tyrosinilytica]
MSRRSRTGVLAGPVAASARPSPTSQRDRPVRTPSAPVLGAPARTALPATPDPPNRLS